MTSPFREILLALIFVFVIVWLITSRKSVATRRIEAPASSLLHSLLLLAGFLVVFLNSFQTSLLALRLIPESLLINMAGVSISILGTAFAVWARILLGSNWSAKVAIKEGQRLIQNGPYAVVRNPIYSGALFFMIGAALVSGQVRGLVGLGLVLIYAWLKGKTEERFLSEEFGEEYREYQKRVKFMIPFII